MYYLYEGLGPKSLKTVKLWENAGQKILEAELTADQIKQLFQQVEQGVTAGGGNRTTIGKGKDVATAVNKAWEDLKTKVQDSGPVKGVDAMYDKAADKLKQATGGDEGVMKYVQKYRDFAKKHPIAQSLIYSALIAAAGISGAGVGGAAALGLFKLVDKLLQGEKFSSAAYAGAKTGGMAYAAGQIGQAIKGQPQQAPYGSQPGENEFVGMSDVPGTSQAGSIISSGGQAISNSPISYEQALEQAKRTGATGLQAKNLARSIMKGATAAATQTESVKLSENQIYYAIGAIVNRQQKLSEGVVDAVKGAAGKAANWAQTKGHNVTTKITADKLLQAWNKAGKPTDSEKVSQVLTSAGVPQDTVSSVFTAMKIPTQSQATNTKTNDATTAPQTPQADTQIQPNTPTDTTQGNKMNSTTEPANTTYSQVKTLIDKMDKGGKKRMADALKKSLGMISESKEQIQQNLQQLQQQQYNLEAVINQVRQTTKAIKHDDTIHGIMNGIKQLAQKAGIDASELRYAENQVLDAFNELESAVYGLEEAFTDKLRDVQNQVEDLEYELENPDELDEVVKNSHGHTKKQQAAIAMAKQGVAEGHADQQRKIFKKNGKPVGEVGIDPEASPGNGNWYMKCYAYNIDNAGYDSYEEAIEELKHCLKQGLAEGSENNNTTAQKIFFARSNKAPKEWSYDHVGFITQDGKQIQMSGHKGNDVYVTNDVTDDPEFPKQNIKIVSLSKPVSVPTTNSVGAENCGTFVANVLQANDIKGIDTQKIYSVFKKPQEQGVAEGRLNEFAPAEPQDGDGDVPPNIYKLANRWWNNTDDQLRIAHVLRSMGWDIQQADGEEDVCQLTYRDGTVYYLNDGEFDPELYEHVDSNRPAKVLAKNLKKLTNVDYDTVDRLMKAISKKYNLSNDGKDLHVMFAKLYGHNPDYWVRKQKGLAEGEHDAEFIDDEDSFYNMVDFAHKEMRKGKSLQDIIKYLVDNNYLGFMEVNSFTKEVRGEKWNESVAEADSKHPGLWANIHAKRERIKHGSHEHMRKPGSKGAPTAQAFKDSAKTSKNESSIMSGVKNVSR